MSAEDTGGAPSLRRCRTCRSYTLLGTCPHCGAATGTPHPARFSPQDPYAKYRRALLAEDLRRQAKPAPTVG